MTCACESLHSALTLIPRSQFSFSFLLTFTVSLPHPVGAVGGHDTFQLPSYQLVFGRALQGNDCTDVGAVSLDDPLGA